MKYTRQSPSLLQEIGSIAGLYREVIWMFGQRIQHGRDWQQHLQDEAMHAPRQHDADAAERIAVHHN